MVFIKIYHTLGGQYFIHGKEFPKGTVVLQTDNGIELFCTNFNTARSRKMLVIIYKEKEAIIMAQAIGSIVAFIIVFGIPYLISKKNEKIEAEKNAEEFMKKHFGEDYKDRINRR